MIHLLSDNLLFKVISISEVIIGVLVPFLITILTYIVIYSLKPNLKIQNALIEDSTVRIEIINKGRFDAVNIRVEICAFDEVKRHSYHFITDHKDFLVIPSGHKGRDNEKVFKTIRFRKTSDTKHETYDSLIVKLREKELRLRVRLHSYHSFSGLGKAEEKFFDL
jgi:uncharacterized membrane protein